MRYSLAAAAEITGQPTFGFLVRTCKCATVVAAVICNRVTYGDPEIGSALGRVFGSFGFKKRSVC